MSEPGGRANQRDDRVSAGRGPNWGRRLVFGGLAILGALIVYLIGAAVIPRWWAQRVGNFVDGRISVGATAGMFCGVLFTVLPLLVLWMAWRFRRNMKVVLWLVAFAVVLAIPNLMTLAIVLGTRSAAHAGERILERRRPWVPWRQPRRRRARRRPRRPGHLPRRVSTGEPASLGTAPRPADRA
jgi:hypothetical protein